MTNIAITDKKLVMDLIQSGKAMGDYIRQNPDINWDTIIDYKILRHAGRSMLEVIKALPNSRWEQRVGRALDKTKLETSGKVLAEILVSKPDLNWREVLSTSKRYTTNYNHLRLVADLVTGLSKLQKQPLALKVLNDISGEDKRSMVQALHDRNLNDQTIWGALLNDPATHMDALYKLSAVKNKTISNNWGLVRYARQQPQQIAGILRENRARLTDHEVKRMARIIRVNEPLPLSARKRRPTHVRKLTL